MSFLSSIKDAFTSVYDLVSGRTQTFSVDAVTGGTGTVHHDVAIADPVAHQATVSARNAFTGRNDSIAPSLSELGKAASNVISPIVSPANSGSVVQSTSPDWSYLNADLANHYGMDRETAYQEALANTSHQREVADLKAAGLNPVLSASGGSGAAVFGGSTSAPGAVISSGATSGKGVASAVAGLVTLLATHGNFRTASSAAAFTSMLENSIHS